MRKAQFAIKGKDGKSAEVVFFHFGPGAVKEDLAELGVAGDLADGAHIDAIRVEIGQDVADPVARFGVRVRSGEQVDAIRIVRFGGLYQNARVQIMQRMKGSIKSGLPKQRKMVGLLKRNLVMMSIMLFGVTTLIKK